MGDLRKFRSSRMRNSRVVKMSKRPIRHITEQGLFNYLHILFELDLIIQKFRSCFVHILDIFIPEQTLEQRTQRRFTPIEILID